jgi:hypothetical protein
LTKIALDVDADIVDLNTLANVLVDKIYGYIEEQKMYNENDLDGFYDYISGLIAAYQSVAGMIGVPFEIAYPDGDC